ncbi:hypothetical protein [Corallincola spongiicola]|uniref:Uncharacterized protein n=1 Tax=Corallincola spongiicola TaxID=2520508 RepID=A0ABY1WT05_9GAMM|nr:hypothetical protein [Corallincola spongiicola]TAA47860.1 hypothetical protein EXY25_01015 [Corallincola spongiicola]
MSLKRYLEQIRAGKQINWDKFHGLLPLGYEDDWRDIFTVTKRGAKQWQVTVIDPIRYEQLLAAAEKPANRIQASAQGDSHLATTTCSYLLVYRMGLPDARPDVVLLKPEGAVQGFAAKKQLLLVENEENFFHPELMLDVASDMWGQTMTLANTDVALASGSQGLSPQRVHWYQRYAEVICAFDYDTAGLEMYAALNKQMRRNREQQEGVSTQVSYLQPLDYSAWLPLFKCQPKSDKSYMRGRKLAYELGFVTLEKAFAKTRKFMEQEMLLRDRVNTE